MGGNVLITLKAKKHSKFQRRGDDLHIATQVSLREALLGWSQDIRHMDGHIVHLETQSVTAPLQIFKIEGEGMPLRDDPTSFGDLYVKVDVAFPTTLDAKQRSGIEAVLPAEGPKPEL